MIEKIKIKEIDNYIKGYGFLIYPISIQDEYDALQEFRSKYSSDNFKIIKHKVTQEFVEDTKLPKYQVGVKSANWLQKFYGNYIPYTEIPRGKTIFYLEVEFEEAHSNFESVVYYA